ncbi:MAG: ABC transporter ATP-binding protein [Gammaproteobacteria bacterium]
MSELRLHQLTCVYNNKTVFNNINLHIEPGEFVAILGPSGCGKSTLLRAIAGLIQPQTGEVNLGGRVGLVFQDYALFPHKTVYENIAFGLHSASAPFITSRVEELLSLIDMTAFSDKKPHQLSGGQQQRVAIARALAPRPTLLLLDEPFANVDHTLTQTLSEALQLLTQHEKVSVLLVTHDWSEAFSLADRMAILEPSEHGSRIVQDDTPQYIYQRPINSYVATLFGSTTLIPGIATDYLAETALGVLPLATSAMGPGYLVLRSEMASFREHPDGNVTVLARQFQGRSYRVLCETLIGKLLAETASTTPPAVGARGYVNIQQPCWWVK